MDGMNPPPGRALPLALAFAFLLVLAGCGGGGGGDDGLVLGARKPVVGLEQAAFDGARYTYGAGSVVPSPAIDGAPDDTDFSRWAMLHDGSAYRLYFMRLGDDATLYQFGYNATTRAYEFGYDSIAQLGVTGAPPGADASSIAMLHDGVDYRLYMRNRSDPTLIHQFGFNRSTGDYEYGYHSIANIRTTNVPPDADLSRWAMLHDGAVYRQYVARTGSETTLYQFGFNGSSYEFGHRSIVELDVVNMPSSSDTASFAMQHGGGKYRFFHLSR